MASISINELKQIIKETLKEFKDDRGAGQVTVPSNTQSSFSTENPKKQYQALAFEYYSMKNLVGGSIRENEEKKISPLLDKLNKDEWEEPNAKSFMVSLYSSKRKQFLTPYTEQEFAAMSLYKLKDANVGFAIKKDGDIIGVHNNQEGHSGLGDALVEAAKRNKGTKLDHFDGYLTGLYSRTGFGKVVHIDEWNEEYAPNGWEYEKVDIFSPRFSAFASKPQIKQLASEIASNPKALATIAKNYNIPIPLVNAIRNYQTGRPSIVYRVLG